MKRNTKASLAVALDKVSSSGRRAGVASLQSPGRNGKKAITGFFDPKVSRQLRHMALDKDLTLQDLMREALNDLFQKHGQPTIA